MTEPTGLTYLRARYYHPTSGTFMSPDPVLGVVGGPASTFNPYLYVRGNPVNWTDPSGMFLDSLTGAGSFLGDLGNRIGGAVQHLVDKLRCFDAGKFLRDFVLGTVLAIGIVATAVFLVSSGALAAIASAVMGVATAAIGTVMWAVAAAGTLLVGILASADKWMPTASTALESISRFATRVGNFLTSLRGFADQAIVSVNQILQTPQGQGAAISISADAYVQFAIEGKGIAIDFGRTIFAGIQGFLMGHYVSWTDGRFWWPFKFGFDSVGSALIYGIPGAIRNQNTIPSIIVNAITPTFPPTWWSLILLLEAQAGAIESAQDK